MRSSKQNGVSTVTAIMLVTVLAVLATAAIRMLHTAGNDATLDMQSRQAGEAARSAMQLGFWRVAQTGSCVATTNINNLPGMLTPYTATLTCTSSPYADGGAVTRYTLRATACNQPLGGACPNNAASNGNNYVEAVETGECLVRGANADCY